MCETVKTRLFGSEFVMFHFGRGNKTKIRGIEVIMTTITAGWHHKHLHSLCCVCNHHQTIAQCITEYEWGE